MHRPLMRLQLTQHCTAARLEHLHQRCAQTVQPLAVAEYLICCCNYMGLPLFESKRRQAPEHQDL
jgi:hypothetical protein